MPRSSKGARLHLRAARRDAVGNITHHATWIIRDGGRDVFTGCAANEVAKAEQRLKHYIAEKYVPQRKVQDIDAIAIADVLAIFIDDRRRSPSQQATIRSSDDASECLVGRENAVGGDRRALQGVPGGAPQQGWGPARSRGSACRDQSPREGRATPRDRSGQSASAGYPTRPLAHPFGGCAADLGLLARP